MTPAKSAPRLKPCPFCGDGNPLIDSFHFGNSSRVVCLKCFTDGPHGNNESEGIRRWNRRAKGAK